jgi:hypothetical protein
MYRYDQDNCLPSTKFSRPQFEGLSRWRSILRGSWERFAARNVTEWGPSLRERQVIKALRTPQCTAIIIVLRGCIGW